METLVLGGSDSGAITGVHVRPVVMVSILDHYLRRKEDRVVGALFGSVSNGIIEVTNCYGVVFSMKDDKVRAPIERLRSLIAMNKKLYPGEQIVGWYSTVSTGAAREAQRAFEATGVREVPALLDDISLVFHTQLFSELMPRPMHLVLDASMLEDSVRAYAFVSSGNPLVEKLLIPMLQLPVTLTAAPEERVAIDAMMRGLVAGAGGRAFLAAGAGKGSAGEGGDYSTLSGELEALEGSMKRLHSLLDAVLAHVDAVVAGKAEPEEGMGRAISEALAALPAVDPAAFERVFTHSLKDLLMVSYLASLASAQLKLSERIVGQVHYTAPGAAGGAGGR